METPMATNTIDVKKATPAPVPAATDPWRVLRGEVDRLFDRFSGGFGVPSLRRMFDWEPAFGETQFGFAAPVVDVSEDDKSYKICAELPGLEAKDVDISIAGDTVLIKGEKRQEQERKEENYHMTERSYGSFQRAFALPEGVDRDKITADLSKGVLTLTLPKSAEAQKPAKKIEVKSAT
jgi:HSP20 family protein